MNPLKFLFSRIRYANSGLKYFFSNERNGQTQLIAAVIVTAFGIYFRLEKMEWCVLLIMFAVILGLEMMNTAIEVLCNHVTPDMHPKIKIIKDVAAGAVWWASMLAVVIGIMIFYPYFVLLFR